MALEGQLSQFVARAVVVLAACVAATYALSLDSNLLSAMDETRGVLLSMRSTQPLVKEKFGGGVVVDVVTKIAVVEKSGIKGASWTSRRRRSFRKVTTVTKRKPATVKTYKANLNKYMLAINQIEKGILEAGAMNRFMTNTAANLQKLRDSVKTACHSRQYILARKLVGHAVYLASLVTTSGRKRRQSTGSSPSMFITDLKGEIGNDQFTKLLALDGGVTLSFAIDTTGSMADEIHATKSIAADIINQPRTYLVDYVLSPFSDPGYGPVIYRPPEQKNTFIATDLAGLVARGGGDCAELAITGIQEIFASSILEFSPIYVFTDAGPKDATPDNLDTLLTSALAFATPINFFLSKSFCLKEPDIKVYRDIALETGGEVLIFDSGGQLKDMSSYITNALAGGSVIPYTGGTTTNAITISGRRRRSTSGRSEYNVQVDNTVERLTASVSTEKDTSDVILLDPNGRSAPGTKKSLRRGAVIVVMNPMEGKWKITVSNKAGKHTVNFRAVSTENIDFAYEFLVGIKSRLRGTKTVASNTPIKGQEASVIISVSGYSKVLPGTLTMEVLDQSMRSVGITRPLQPYGTSPGRFTAKYTTAASLAVYYLAIKGKTRAGVEFSRMSPKPVKPQTIVIQTMMARKGFTIKAGDSGGTTIILALRNLGATERFTTTVADSKGYLVSQSKRTLLAIKDRSSLLVLKFKAPSTAKRGSTYTAQVIVRGTTSKGKQLKAVMMLVV